MPKLSRLVGGYAAPAVFPVGDYLVARGTLLSR